MKVTAQVAVAHGVSPGQTFTLQGFTGTGFTGYNATYTALPGTDRHDPGRRDDYRRLAPARPRRSTRLPMRERLSVEPAVRLRPPPSSPTNPWSHGMTGITSHVGQHFCGIIGEYGPDSSFPGAQFVSFVDDKGNALPGAPALVPWLNQGTANLPGTCCLTRNRRRARRWS